MCVIIYKPKNVNLPAIEDLKLNFKQNPDGAGYMLPLNGSVLIKKGFMTFDDFITDLNKTINDNHLNVQELPIVIHFRITTQGGVKKALCHPFPICKSYTRMRMLTYTCSLALAHNGIISRCTDYRATNHNDTMTFIKDYASEIIDNDLLFASKRSKVNLLAKISASKLAIMNKFGYVKLIGKFEQRNDVFYSNLNAFNHEWLNLRLTRNINDNLFKH